MTLQEHAKISICKQKKTNLIKTFLHSPYILISKVLREYATPSTMKLANVTRVLKKDSHSEKEDYQPLTTSSYTFFSRPLCTILYGTKSDMLVYVCFLKPRNIRLVSFNFLIPSQVFLHVFFYLMSFNFYYWCC